MLFTELAVQNVAGFPATARIPLKGGLNALVGREAELVRVLRAVLYPGLDTGRSLCTGPGPHKAACTIVGRDGATWRVVRDLSTGAQSLLRSDASTQQAQKISADPDEIARHLATAVGLPPEHAFRSIFSLAAADLPSRVRERAAAQRAAPTPTSPAIQTGGALPPPSAFAATDAPVIETPSEAKARLPALRKEYARAEALEKAQDAQYELQNELSAIAAVLEPLTKLESEIETLAQKLSVLMKRTADINTGLEQKVRRYPEAQARRDAALAELAKKKTQAEEALGIPPKFVDLGQDPFFGGGVLVGVLATAAAIFLEIPTLWVVNLVAFAVAGFGAWQWVGRVQEDEDGRRRLLELNEFGKRIHKQYEQDTKPVQQAMRAFGVATPEDLLHQLEERDLLDARRVALERELATRRADPSMADAERRRADTETRLRARETEVNALGFSRDAAVVRRELEAAEELAALAVDEGDLLAKVVEGSAVLVGAPPPAFVESIRERLAQYLGALTDQRFVSVNAIGPGVCHVVAATGGSGPLAGLPVPDQDAIMVAVRLTLAERLGVPAKMPVFVDEPTLIVDAAHRGVFVKMLRALGAQTQVVVKAFEAPPAGVVDHVARVSDGSATHAA